MRKSSSVVSSWRLRRCSEGFLGRDVMDRWLLCSCAVVAPGLFCGRSASALFLFGDSAAVALVVVSLWSLSVVFSVVARLGDCSVVALRLICVQKGCSETAQNFLGGFGFVLKLFGGCSRITLTWLSACYFVAARLPLVALRLF